MEGNKRRGVVGWQSRSRSEGRGGEEPAFSLPSLRRASATVGCWRTSLDLTCLSLLANSLPKHFCFLFFKEVTSTIISKVQCTYMLPFGSMLVDMNWHESGGCRVVVGGACCSWLIDDGPEFESLFRVRNVCGPALAR